MRSLLLTGLLSLGIVSAGFANDGEALYATYCTQCHGITGDGNGINAPHMSVQPRDHTERSEMAARTDEDLINVIRGGGKAINKSVLMPAWDGNFDDAEIGALVEHMRALCCSAGQP